MFKQMRLNPDMCDVDVDLHDLEITIGRFVSITYWSCAPDDRRHAQHGIQIIKHMPCLLETCVEQGSTGLD
jgi:hypothetical protein